ncbi:IucA/IucC family protein [Streptomyces sp. I05A-00742]|uniref:IucA/IucC family protein n=1 Tax=Streptomyces sp. I05A-00742 TaxID=2732853 RepID=UPI001489CA3E|nr:IucA/IucC family protein [Streptomyces sp. I05A-00742]
MSEHDGADGVEGGLVVRVLDALLREDVCRLRSTARTESRPDGDRLALTVAGESLLLPVVHDGLQCAVRIRAPLLETADGVVTGLDAVLNRLRAAADPDERAGFDAFAAACAAELEVLRLRERARGDVTERLAALYGRTAAEWTGPRGALAFDVLAALRPEPGLPTGRAALGPGELTAYAPEFHPCFGLRWLALPREAVHRGPGDLPEWWPGPDALGLSGLDATHTMLPVHPLTAGEPLDGALRAAGLEGRAHLAEKPWADVVPTRSAGTLAPADAPATRVEVPLAGAVPDAWPGALADGVVAQRLLEEVLLCEPRFVGSVLPADGSAYLRAGHPLLAARVLHRPDPADAQVVPVAALPARTPDGGTVADALAARHYGGSLPAFADAWVTLLLDWHTTLFSYGVALDVHPRSLSVVLDAHRGRPRLRLLYGTPGGLLVNGVRFASRLGGQAADLLGFADRRTLAGHDGPVADALATGALYRCAVEPLDAFARDGRGSRAGWLRLVRDRLAEAVDRVPPGAATVLRTRLLDSGALPVRAAVTGGAGRRYLNGPNYLAAAGD